MQVDAPVSVSPFLHYKMHSWSVKSCLINFKCKCDKLTGLLTLTGGSDMLMLILLLVGEGFHLAISPSGGKQWLDGSGD